ncbi:Hypothetical Protein FCC1311_060342 [Hondaea fermentalgiana]|uniref:Uncharacterized protein n=1 Tax=Hondaea fermentalgiana TaxID=2315210 RepID=A0A2R5GPK9_9STRA|nr:Hypothetical Protein FCC1311_060342 [Hondaea fermentalgiana]|eukprot:GBG29814.1 Hypothetical Protein FCC1311_060342 [Hondaea fermentalgiana]
MVKKPDFKLSYFAPAEAHVGSLYAVLYILGTLHGREWLGVEGAAFVAVLKARAKNAVDAIADINTLQKSRIKNNKAIERYGARDFAEAANPSTPAFAKFGTSANMDMPPRLAAVESFLQKLRGIEMELKKLKDTYGKGGDEGFAGANGVLIMEGLMESAKAFRRDSVGMLESLHKRSVAKFRADFDAVNDAESMKTKCKEFASNVLKKNTKEANFETTIRTYLPKMSPESRLYVGA